MVLAVHKRNLSLLTGGVEIRAENGENKLGVGKGMGGIVNRLVQMVNLTLLAGLLAGVLSAQEAAKKAATGNSAAVARGKTIFQQRCAVCHYDTSTQKKIGPGLKGISKRGTFSVSGNKLTDESLKNWIENGDQLMPPFKEVLEAGQIKDLTAYVKTL